jgi:hypothetical protein
MRECSQPEKGAGLLSAQKEQLIISFNAHCFNSSTLQRLHIPFGN